MQLFPLSLSYDEIPDIAPWKLRLDFDQGAQKYKLSVDGIEFFKLAYQPSAECNAPQFINSQALIKLNN